MAAVTHAVTTADTTDGLTYESDPFTPVAGDLLVVCMSFQNTLEEPVVTGSEGLTFVAASGSSTNRGIYVAEQFATAVEQTVTGTWASDTLGGCITTVLRISGMSRTGADAVRQSLAGSGASSTTPTVTFASAALTGNPTVGLARNTTNPAGLTEPDGWTEHADEGHATPNHGLEVVSRDSGFTGTEITWGDTSASGWVALIAEFDASVASSQTVVRRGQYYDQLIVRIDGVDVVVRRGQKYDQLVADIDGEEVVVRDGQYYGQLVVGT